VAELLLGGFACGDPMGRRGGDVEVPNNGGSIAEKGVRHSAKGGNAEAGSRTHVRCACAAADVRGARGQHTGLGPWARRLPNSTTPRSPAAATTRAALDAIMVWKVSVDSRKVSTICASMMGPVTRSRGSSLKMACLRERPRLPP
jgi:hypothetical protein